MKRRLLAILLMLTLAVTFSFTACGSDEEAPAAEPEETTEEAAEPEVDATKYGYGGTDPVEAAVYQYMVEEVSKSYDKTDVSIPTVSIVHVDFTPEDEILVYGDFWIDNYNIKGDTLRDISGGNYPGVIHLSKDYVVTAFDQVANGGDFDASAKELFGDYYDDFIAVYNDSDARAELRRATVTDYVHFNGLDVKQYKDKGWPAVELYE